MQAFSASCAEALAWPTLKEFQRLYDCLATVAIPASAQEKVRTSLGLFSEASVAGSFTEQAVDLYRRHDEVIPKAVKDAIRELAWVWHLREIDPVASDWGRRQIFFDGSKCTIDSYPLNPAGFPVERDEIASEYWTQKKPALPFNATAYLAPEDFPANLIEILHAWDAEKVDIDVEIAEATVKSLLEEASALRQWTIPPRAYVELRVGPFVGVELTEIGSEVHFVWRTSSNRYWLTSAGIENRRFDDEWPMADPTVHGRLVELALRLLMAAMVRDFWVTEERRKVFEIVTRRRVGTSSPKAKAIRRVIYLPRIRYAASGLRFARLAEGLQLAARARHYVRPFFRKVDNPSPLQLEIAAGFTYVRGHYRGGAATEAVYRSRSAMNLLYEAIEPPASALASDRPLSDDWFEFERAVFAGRTLGLFDHSPCASRQGRRWR